MDPIIESCSQLGDAGPDLISPVRGGADLTSGLLSVNAFSASSTLLVLFGIRPRTRTAVAIGGLVARAV
jgi:hypothetical protein